MFVLDIYLANNRSETSLVVDSGPDPDTGKSLASSVHHGGLGLDGSLEEGEQDLRDVLDGSEDGGVSSSVDSGHEGQGTGLALGHVGGAQEVCELPQEVVGVVVAGSNVETLNLQAGDLDGDDALEDKVEVDGGSRGNLLQQGDRGAVLHQDREGSHFKHVKGDRFGAAVTEAILQFGRRSQASQLEAEVFGGGRGHEEGEDEELHR